MEEPTDPKALKRIKKSPKYYLHDSDDEEDDTVETRRSVKTAEKQLKHRFWINAREKKDYNKALAAGTISEEQMDFNEDEDEELGAHDPTKAGRKAAKKQAKIEEHHKKKEEKKKPAKQKKEEEEKADKEDEIAKAKEDRPDNAVPEEKKKVDTTDPDGVD